MCHSMGGRGFEPRMTTDALILSLAALHLGRVTRRELVAHGVTRHEIASRIHAGLLIPALPGVYAAGHRGGGVNGRLMEAWLYGGDDAILSARGAGAFWQMSSFGPIDVSVPGRRRGAGRIIFHRARIPDNEWVTRDNLRVTTPARTLLDLAAILPAPHLQRVFTEAEVLQHVDQAAIAHILAAHPGARGGRALADLAGLTSGATRRGYVQTRFEIRYRSLVESTDLDFPVYNHRVETCGRVYVLDAFHERARIAVEVDGGPAHRAGERFHTDRERDRHLLVAGIRTVRLTHDHFERADRLYEDLVALVGRRAPT